MSSAETKIAAITVNSINHSCVIIKPYEYNNDQILQRSVRVFFFKYKDNTSKCRENPQITKNHSYTSTTAFFQEL